MQQLQCRTNQHVRLFAVGQGSNRWFQQPGSGVETWQSVSGTVDQTEQLRSGVGEIEELWDEEQK